jgi:putative methanogenesis marker protein 7
MFEGGVYRSKEMEDLIEDLGGFILQKSVMQTEIALIITVSEEDAEKIKEKAKRIRGEIKEVPLANSEIIIVVPSLGKHHLPHPVCDIAEYLRRKGAVTNIMGLARGVGRRVSQISVEEKKTIEEYDAAVFIVGNFANCIKEKVKLCEMINIPYIIVGGPDIDVEFYIGGVGRRTERMRRKEDLEKLEEIAELLENIVNTEIGEIAEDPLAILPVFLKEVIEQQIPSIKADYELPIVIHSDGLKIKSEDLDGERIKEIKIGERKMGEICYISKGMEGNLGIKVLPESITGKVF